MIQKSPSQKKCNKMHNGEVVIYIPEYCGYKFSVEWNKFFVARSKTKQIQLLEKSYFVCQISTLQIETTCFTLSSDSALYAAMK